MRRPWVDPLLWFLDPQQFELLREVGEEFFHFRDSSETPCWMRWLIDDVTTCIKADCPLGPLGLRYRHEHDLWNVSIYPNPVELVSGANDGAVVTPGFSLDLERPRSAFDSIAEWVWHSQAWDWREGPHVSVEGRYQRRKVSPQVRARAPEDEGKP